MKKGLNREINKANVANIKIVSRDIFNYNLYRGRGLFARFILRAQAASPGYSHVYAALVAVVNSKMPKIVSPILHRLLG